MGSNYATEKCVFISDNFIIHGPSKAYLLVNESLWFLGQVFILFFLF